jgi:hypothetical protein
VRPNLSHGSPHSSLTLSAAVGPSIAALVANIVVLSLAAVVFCGRRTRRLLRRQSLIMLLSVQVVGIIYDAAYMCVAAYCCEVQY